MTGKIIAGPEIQARGFAEDDEIFNEVMPQLEQALAEATAKRRHRLLPAPAGHPPLGRRLGRRARSAAAR